MENEMPGYHLIKIQKGELGKISKIQEELDELKDAHDQHCRIMAGVELADLYGAIEEYAKTIGYSMSDLAIFNQITKRAFKNGARK